MEASPEYRPAAGTTDLRGIRLALVLTLGGVLLGLGGLDIVVARQTKLVRGQLRANETMLRNFNERDEPVLRALITRLADFTRKNPDFKPIYDAHVNAIAQVQNQPANASTGVDGTLPAPVGPTGDGLPPR